jgi:hypothetical protein
MQHRLSSSTVLTQAAGWIVIILFGFLFALLAVFLVSSLSRGKCMLQQRFAHAGPTSAARHILSGWRAWQVWVDIKFAGIVYNSEQFNTAGRSIGTGLLAVDVASHWTWASIL